jgi:hypothetical protein
VTGAQEATMQYQERSRVEAQVLGMERPPPHDIHLAPRLIAFILLTALAAFILALPYANLR